MAEKFTNLSTRDSFGFVFHCERCGAGVHSERYRFNTRNINHSLDERSSALLWTRQHLYAYERAVNEARFEFNLCPVCKRRVCVGCFLECEETAAGMCVDCRVLPEKP